LTLSHKGDSVGALFNTKYHPNHGGVAMSKRWLTGLPISAGKSYELFVHGEQVAHLMHAQGAAVSTFALINRGLDFGNLQRDTAQGIPGLTRSDRGNIIYILNRCYLIDDFSVVSIYACQEHGSAPNKAQVFNILRRIGRGLERRLLIPVPHLVRPGTAFHNSPPQAINETLPDLTSRGAAYCWLADNVRWVTATTALAQTWVYGEAEIESIKRRARNNLGVPAKIVRTTLQAIND